MRIALPILCLFAFGAISDLEVWTPEMLESTVMLDSIEGVQLHILSQYQGWGYSASVAVVWRLGFALPDSFALNGVPVSPDDYEDTLLTEGFVQVLAQYPLLEYAPCSSSLPDTLSLACISCLFRSEPESLLCRWVLEDSLYSPLAPNSMR